MKKSPHFKNLIEFIQVFSTDEDCRKFLEQVLWNNNPVCPHCKHTKAYRISGKTFKCANNKCYKQFTVIKGTIFENTNLSLTKWFIAIYFITSHKKGISSIQLSKHINVTQKTAWFMLQKIRIAFQPKLKSIFKNIVEVDETYVGGKYKNKHYSKRLKGQQGRGGSQKIPVFGILQRNGRVLSRKVDDVKGKTLKPIIYQYVKPNSTIMSDEWKSYRGLNKDYNHLTVDHGRYQYVNGDCHTNGLENFWSHVKRSIFGNYHWVSRKYIDRYCAEFDFRYNTRKQSDALRFTTFLMMICESITQKELNR